MIHGRYIGQGEDISAVEIIREQIFADDFPEYDLHIETDSMALNALIDLDGELIGVGRLVLDLIEDRFYTDNIGIIKEHRGNGYGDFTVRMLVDKAEQCGAKEIWAEVPAFADDFFKKMFFEVVGTSEGLSLMRADIASFKSCCSAGCDVSACGMNGKGEADIKKDCDQDGCGACCGGSCTQ